MNGMPVIQTTMKPYHKILLRYYGFKAIVWIISFIVVWGTIHYISKGF